MTVANTGPNETLKVLLLDDDPTVLREGGDNLQEQLGEKGINCQLIRCDRLNEAIEELCKQRFHLAVIDLKLADENDGNVIIARIVDTQVVPIIVYTGYVEELDADFSDHGLIGIVSDKRIDNVIEVILEWHAKHVFAVFSEDGLIARSMRRALLWTMWEHVSRRWKDLQVDDPKTLERIAGRIAATLMHDSLMHTSDPEEDEAPIHHGEIYVFKSPREHLAPGDIVNVDDRRWAVVTPACDLVGRGGKGAKASRVTCCECVGFDRLEDQHERLRQALADLESDNVSKRQKAEGSLPAIMRHARFNEAGQYFFLPPFATFDGGVVDFLQLRTMPYSVDDIPKLVEQREVSVNREVAGELSTRFARYLLRLGQAPFDSQALAKSMAQLRKRATQK